MFCFTPHKWRTYCSLLSSTEPDRQKSGREKLSFTAKTKAESTIHNDKSVTNAQIDDR